MSTPNRLADVPPSTRALVGAVVAWSLVWKGVSLWRAARNGSRPWFVALLLTNTLGILDAVYVFGVGRAGRGAVGACPSTERDLSL